MVIRKKVLLGVFAYTGLFSMQPVAAHSLSQAIQLAINHNPEVLSARQGIGVADAQLDQAKAGWLPTVDLALDAGHERIQNEGRDRTGLARNSASITLNQPIFDGGASSAAIERSEKTHQISTIHFDEIRTAVALKAIEVWHELFRLQRVIRLTEANVGEHRKLYNQIKQKVEAGGAARSELIAAETPWLLAQNALIQARGDYQDALAEYIAIVGLEPNEKLGNGLNLAEEIMPHTLSDAVQLLLGNNFILRTAEANVLAAKADYDGARAGLLPTLDFELKGGRKQNDAGSEGIDYDTTALLKLNYNLFRGGADESRRRELARAMLDSQEQLNLANRNMVEQLTQYWNGNQVARQLLSTSHQQLVIAKENHESAKEQFKLGEGDVMAIMATSDALLVAKKSVLSDEIDVHLGRYRLLSHMGFLLQNLNVTDVEMVVAMMDENMAGESKMGWVDQMISQVGSEPLLNPPSALEQEIIVAESQRGTVETESEFKKDENEGWVVLEVLDQLTVEESQQEQRAAAPALPATEKDSKKISAAMVMVGGGESMDSVKYQRDRAERRRMELKRRLSVYRKKSSHYRLQFANKERQLGGRLRSLEEAKLKLYRRLAMQ